ncbi:MAG: metallophosphoesterase [Candidatus Woesearchaeota archaeon]
MSVQKLIEKGVLIDPEVIKKYTEKQIIEVSEFFEEKIDVIDEELLKNYLQNKNQNKIKILKNYTKKPEKKKYQDFVDVFNLRFEKISQMLLSRTEMGTVTSISRILKKNKGERVSTIAMVLEKNITKNNNVILIVEDPTQVITIIVKEDDKELHQIAKDLQLDEIIGINGVFLGDAIFANQIIFPDIPISNELKKGPKDEYVIFMGDQHFGSNVFLKKEYQKFTDWINGKIGTQEHKEIARKVKYIVMTGDLIEGAGIYPNQDKDLEIIDVKEQYELTAKLLREIPSHIQMITTTGNHDVGRIAEPQPPIPKEYAKSLHEIPNLKIVSNPAWINIGSTPNFPGFDILLYHGGSLIYYSENIPSVREAGGQKRVDLILEFYLKRRHLAPTHGSTLIIPDPKEDALIVDKIPDFLATGHIHRISVSNYKNVTALNTSAWTETTEDQIKRGLEPQPGRIVLVNLKTRKVKIMNFLSKKQKEKEKEIQDDK